MKKFVIILLVIIGVGFAIYNYIYQDHRDIAAETPSTSTTANQIHTEFFQNPQSATTKYLDKTVEIKGTISSKDAEGITLNQKIYCIMAESESIPKAGENVELKGRVIGYDELLNELKLDQCYIINQKIEK